MTRGRKNIPVRVEDSLTRRALTRNRLIHDRRKILPFF